MKSKRPNSKKKSIAKIDKSLNKYDNVVLFPEKLAKANEELKKYGLPKELMKRNK